MNGWEEVENLCSGLQGSRELSEVKTNYIIIHLFFAGVQLQTHPNIDKKLFLSNSHIGLKNPAKPFPTNNDVGVLKWRLQTTGKFEDSVHIICIMPSAAIIQDTMKIGEKHLSVP